MQLTLKILAGAGLAPGTVEMSQTPSDGELHAGELADLGQSAARANQGFTTCQMEQQLSTTDKAHGQASGTRTSHSLGRPDKLSSTTTKLSSAVAEDERGRHGV